MSTTIQTYRYQYRQPSSSSSSYLPSSRFSLSPPRNTLPHHYLESPTNIFSSYLPPEKIIIHQVGGPGDNHVQWVSVSDITAYHTPHPAQPTHPEDSHGYSQPSTPSVNLGEGGVSLDHNQTLSILCNGKNGAHDNGGGKRQVYRPDLHTLNTANFKRLDRFESRVHGTVRTANWLNDVGDRLWLRSDQPIIRGRKSVPVVNVDKGVNGEVCISHVTWHPHKRDLTTNATITFIGAEYRHSQGYRHGGEPFRMCIIQDHSSYDDGVIEMIPLEELESCFEDVDVDIEPVEPVTTKQGQRQQQIPLSLPLGGPQRPKGPRPMPTLPSTTGSVPTRYDGDAYHEGSRLIKGPAIFGQFGELGESNSRRINDDEDDKLSQASFASSIKSKVALDLVAQSLSIFNFNAAMLDLAALSNQGMYGMGSGLIRDVDERPEASEDDSDEENEGGEGEERMWSDCESIQSTGRGNDEDGNKNERNLDEDSGSTKEEEDV